MFKSKEVSVSSIMATFTETITKLTTHANTMDVKACVADDEIKAAEAKKATAQDEASKARSIADKLSKIVE